MNLEVVNLFELNILVGSFDSIDNKKLVKDILLSNNKLCDDEYHTNNEDTDFKYSDELDFLVNQINDAYKTATNKKLELLGYWAHIHEYNESTNLHCHADAQDVVTGPHISAVYYLQMPEKSGKLVFDFDINKYQRKRFFVDSSEGSFVLFPSTLDHFVTKNKSKQKRISVSFNFKSIES